MKKLALFLFVAILLTACQPAATLQPTAIPPTQPPASTPAPAPVEAPVGAMTDLVGVWWFPQAPGVVTEFKPDGTFRSWLSVEPSAIEAEGTYAVDAGRLTWVTSHPKCNGLPATYAAYVTRQDGKPVQLRLQLVGSDPCTDRADAFRVGIGKFQPTANRHTEAGASTPTTMPVEALASSSGDLIGVWSLPGMKLEFNADGTFHVSLPDSTIIDDGNYAFDNGRVVWTTTSGCKDKPATYDAYVTKQDGKLISLRLQVVGSDLCVERANSTGSEARFLHP